MELISKHLIWALKHSVSSIVVGGLFFGTVWAQAPAATPPGARAGLAGDPNLDRSSHRTPGTYAAKRVTEPGLPDQTIYRPEDLSKLGKNKMPIIAYGNGGCRSNGGSSAEPFLLELAANGYLVGAGGNFTFGGAEPAAQPQQPPTRGGGTAAAPAARAPMAAAWTGGTTSDEDLVKFIDWAVAENSRVGSPYRGLIDTSAIGTMGHSCGGLQTIVAAGDPRVKTAVVLNSGILRGTAKLKGTNSNVDHLSRLHGPILYLIGGPSDPGFAASAGDFKDIQKIPVFRGDYPVGHGGTYRLPLGGALGEVALRWLDWQLKGMNGEQKYFVGPDCTLCKDSRWTVEKKNMN